MVPLGTKQYDFIFKLGPVLKSSSKRYWGSVLVGIIPTRRPTLGAVYVSIFPSLSCFLMAHGMTTLVLSSADPVFGVFGFLFAPHYLPSPFTLFCHNTSPPTPYPPLSLMYLRLSCMSGTRGKPRMRIRPRVSDRLRAHTRSCLLLNTPRFYITTRHQNTRTMFFFLLLYNIIIVYTSCTTTM